MEKWCWKVSGAGVHEGEVRSLGLPKDEQLGLCPSGKEDSMMTMKDGLVRVVRDSSQAILNDGWWYQTDVRRACIGAYWYHQA